MDGWKPIGYIELRNGVDGSIGLNTYQWRNMKDM